MVVKTATLTDLPILLPTLLILRPNLDLGEKESDFNNQLKEGYQLIYIGDENMAFPLLVLEH